MNQVNEQIRETFTAHAQESARMVAIIVQRIQELELLYSAIGCNRPSRSREQLHGLGRQRSLGRPRRRPGSVA